MLPDSLENYDAIFTDLRFFEDDDSLFIAKELEKLSKYLVVVGKLYIELTGQTTAYRFSGNGSYPEYPPFQELVGAEYGIGSILIMGIQRIYGVKGYFTEGMNYHWDGDPLEVNSSAQLFVSGDVTRIIETNASATLVWQHEKNNQKVIFHWPIVMEHYDEFIGRTICNYYGLCTPLAIPTARNDHSGFSISSATYNSESTEISFHYELSNIEPLVISVFNVLGERIYYSYNNEVATQTSEFRFRPNHKLTTGGYYLQVSSKEGVETAPFFVVD
jgi:hypothetical protein